MYFRYFIIIFPWKRAGPFIRTNLGSGSLHPRMHCAKLGWNWSDVLYLYVYLMCLLIVCYVSMPAVCKVRFIQCFVPRWVEIVWRRRWKCEKFTTTTATPTTTTTTPTKITTTTTTTDNGQILIRKVQLSLRLWWAKKFTRVYLFTLVSNFMYLKPDRIRRFILILMFNVTASGLI